MAKLSIRAYAKHRGVSDTAVRRAIDDERITISPDGLIDPEIADKEWDENTRSEYLPRGHVAEERVSSISQSNRQKKEALEIMLKKLEYDERSGKLIARAEVEIDIFNAARAARDKWLGAPHRIASQVIGKTDITEIEQILNKEFEAFLEVLTSYLRGNKS